MSFTLAAVSGACLCNWRGGVFCKLQRPAGFVSESDGHAEAKGTDGAGAGA
jgi:hypothetical protein